MAVSPTPRPNPVKPLAADPTTRRPARREPAGVSAGPSADLNPALLALQSCPLADALVPPLAVAFSGGADSTALLLAAARRWPGQVTALHVHHGLQAAADEFVKNCTAVSAPLGVPLQVLRVDARHRSGQSPEDAARNSRYRALALAAQQAGLTCVLLGQHADDQVETLLLALGRGAGLPGLSAMPAQFERSGMRFYRPLLQTAGSDLRQWLERQGVAFVDDPSNADERFTRNRLRARVLPALQDALPQFRQTFARSARHAAQAQTLLDELAAEDLLRVGKPPAISALQLLSKARQANVLRHWLASVHQVRPSAAQLEQLLAQIQACRTRGHRIHLKVAAGHVRLDAGALNYTGLAPDGPGA